MLCRSAFLADAQRCGGVGRGDVVGPITFFHLTRSCILQRHPSWGLPAKYFSARGGHKGAVFPPFHLHQLRLFSSPHGLLIFQFHRDSIYRHQRSATCANKPFPLRKLPNVLTESCTSWSPPCCVRHRTEGQSLGGTTGRQRRPHRSHSLTLSASFVHRQRAVGGGTGHVCTF